MYNLSYKYNNQTVGSDEWRRGFGNREDHSFTKGERWLRHLLSPATPIALLANVCIHFCQDGDEVSTPEKTTDMLHENVRKVKVLMLQSSLFRRSAMWSEGSTIGVKMFVLVKCKQPKH